MFWLLWALIGSGLKKPRLYTYLTSLMLTLSLAISLYFKAEFFHLPNINTYLFALDEPLNTVILMKDKAMQLSSLLMLPLFFVSLKFCTELLAACTAWRNSQRSAVRRYVLGGLLGSSCREHPFSRLASFCPSAHIRCKCRTNIFPACSDARRHIEP